MKINTLKFRDLDRHYYFIEDLNSVKKLYKKLRIKKDVHPILVFSYIDHNEGIQFRVLGNIVVQGNSLSLEDDFLQNEFLICYDDFEEYDIKPVPKTTTDKIIGINKLNETLDKHYSNDSLIASRDLKEIDSYRDLRLVDDVQFLLLTKEAQQENVWARIESMDENQVLSCTLLDKPQKIFGLKKNDKICIKYVKHPKYTGLMFIKKDDK